jgi:hypothetical protein
MFRGNVKIKCDVKIRMAQGAIILILFAFCVCLSCISSSAVGSGVFYACSDGTMSPGEFDFNKCLNFGTDDVLQGTDALTGLNLSDDSSDEPASTDLMGGASDTLVPDGPVDVDEASGDAEFLDFFGQASKEYIDGQGTLATGVNTKAACARACYNDEVPMKDELDKCMGFISDGRSRCILYPSQDKVTGTNLPGREKSYTLKRPKDGAVTFHTFNQKALQTNYQLDGGPKEFGGGGRSHDVDCKDPQTGHDGLLTGFKFNPRGTDINVAYNCLFNNSISRETRQNTTSHGPSGSKHECNKDRNEFNYMSGHDMNCGNTFIVRWKHNQWSQSMAVDYNCSKQATADPLGCEDLETDGNFGRACKASDMAPYPVRCPANKALTRFAWNGDGKIVFTCCPKPAPGMAEVGTSASNTQIAADQQAAADAAAAAAAAGSCTKTGGGHGCRSRNCPGKSTADSCNSTPCCTWVAAS